MSELLQASGYAAIVYLLFNYLITFGSGRPLVEWINPGRRYLPLLAGVLVGGAYGSLKYATLRYHVGYGELLHKLIGEDKAPPEVVGAVSFFIFALALMMLAGWCWWNLPRAPQTFSPNPKDLVAEYRRAVRHYVRWHGGLDFAVLAEVRDGKLEVLAEGHDDVAILRGLNRLPGLHAAIDGKQGPADVAGQKQIWAALALDLVNRWPQFNECLYPGRHGKVMALNVELRYGAIYLEMVEEEAALPGGSPTGILLMSVAMNQHEVSTMLAVTHFSLLSRAVRHIRSGVMKG